MYEIIYGNLPDEEYSLVYESFDEAYEIYTSMIQYDFVILKHNGEIIKEEIKC